MEEYLIQLTNNNNSMRENARIEIINLFKDPNFQSNLFTIFEKYSGDSSQSGVLMSIWITFKDYFKMMNQIDDHIKIRLFNYHIYFLNNKKKSITKLIEDCIVYVIEIYFPENCIDIIFNLKNDWINSSDNDIINSHIRTIYLIFKNYYNKISCLDLLETMVGYFIPILINKIFIQIGDYNNNIDNIINFLNIVFYSIQMEIDYYYDKKFFEALIKLLLLIFEVDILNNMDKNNLKIKSIVLKIINLFLLNIKKYFNSNSNMFNYFYGILKNIFYSFFNICNKIFLHNNDLKNIYPKLVLNYLIFTQSLFFYNKSFNLLNDTVVPILFSNIFPFINASDTEIEIYEDKPIEYLENEYGKGIIEFEINNLCVDILLELSENIDNFCYIINIILDIIKNKINIYSNDELNNSMFHTFLFIINRIIRFLYNSDYDNSNIINSIFNIIIGIFNIDDQYILQRYLGILIQFDYRTLNIDDLTLINFSNGILNLYKTSESDLIKFRSIILITYLIKNQNIRNLFGEEFDFIYKNISWIYSKINNDIFHKCFIRMIKYYNGHLESYNDEFIGKIFETLGEKILIIKEKDEDKNEDNIDIHINSNFILNNMNILIRLIGSSNDENLVMKYSDFIWKLFYESFLIENLNFLWEDNYLFSLINLFIFKKGNLDESLIFIYPILCYFCSNTIGQNSQPNENLNELDDFRQNFLLNIHNYISNYPDINFVMLFSILLNLVQKINLVEREDYYGYNYFQLILNVIDYNLKEGKQKNNLSTITMCIKLIETIYESHNQNGNIYEYLINYNINIYKFLKENDYEFSSIYQMVSKFLYINANDYAICLDKANHFCILNDYFNYAFNESIKEEFENKNLLFGFIGIFNSNYENFKNRFDISSLSKICNKIIISLVKLKKKKNGLIANENNYQQNQNENIYQQDPNESIGGSSTSSDYNEETEINNMLTYFQSAFDDRDPVQDFLDFVNSIKNNSLDNYNMLMKHIGDEQQQNNLFNNIQYYLTVEEEDEKEEN